MLWHPFFCLEFNCAIILYGGIKELYSDLLQSSFELNFTYMVTRKLSNQFIQ